MLRMYGIYQVEDNARARYRTLSLKAVAVFGPLVCPRAARTSLSLGDRAWYGVNAVCVPMKDGYFYYIACNLTLEEVWESAIRCGNQLWSGCCARVAASLSPSVRHMLLLSQ